MTRSWVGKGVATGLGWLALVSVPALMAGQEFSAQVTQRGPDGRSTTSKMYVSDDRVRSETVLQGQQVVRITDGKQGLEWVLFPERKAYMERQLGPGQGQPGPAKPTAQDPCAGMPGLTCEMVGEESIGGRRADKWEMTASYEGQAIKGTQWIDKERGPGFLLKQEMPNGQMMERVLLGTEQVAGRDVEKWSIRMSQPGGQSMSTTEWYDPELELALKQELPGGLISELTEVRLGKQPDHLFKIPAGFERISMPHGMPGGPSPR